MKESEYSKTPIGSLRLARARGWPSVRESASPSFFLFVVFVVVVVVVVVFATCALLLLH